MMYANFVPGVAAGIYNHSSPSRAHTSYVLARNIQIDNELWSIFKYHTRYQIWTVVHASLYVHPTDNTERVV